MKNILIILISVLSCFYTHGVAAQTVYAFKYNYTDDDGIKSKEKSKENDVYFIVVQNGYMGICAYSNADVYDKWDYLCQKAINNLAEGLRKRRQGPSNVADVYNLIKYCSEYSTSYKTTYRSCGAEAMSSSGYYGYAGKWRDEVWKRSCYTLNSDNSELICWQVPGSTVGFFDSYFNGSNKVDSARKYYKRITRSDARPNTDFLYE